MGRDEGVSEEQLRDLAGYESSDAFSELEKRVLDLAVGMTRTPLDVPEALIEELSKAFDEGQIVELTTAIAWENFRARFNHSLGIEPGGFTEGAFCPLPQRDP
ncbi:MAG: carboxymuconolactone decarboxylase family protein [Deltaproteobacteria bacterium]|nr:carboxymuconolactone decarboxylase family protein [Deltaproteobacteria bacterium]